MNGDFSWVGDSWSSERDVLFSAGYRNKLFIETYFSKVFGLL